MRGKKGRRQGRRLLNLKKITFGKPQELSANIKRTYFETRIHFIPDRDEGRMEGQEVEADGVGGL